MALVNPNIAMSFRAPEVPQQNMLADYAAIQQIQGGQQAQQLNALKIQEYERTRGEEEGARNFLLGRDLASPDTRTGLTQFGKTGLALAKSLSEQDAATLSMKNVKSQISERDFGLQDKKLKFAWSAIGDSATPELAIEKITDAIKDGVFKPQDGAAEIQQLQNMTPELFRQYRVNKVLQLLDAKDKLVTMLPKIARQDTGGALTPIQDNPALPGYGLPVAGMAAIAKTETFADKNARQRLAFDQNKFNWEKANPGFEIREADDGSVVGVNKRTLQAFPVTLGGGPAPTAAPAAVPAVGGAGMPGARVPAAQAPQAPLAGATPTAGKPLMGKGQAMTETQSNAATFGGAMMQAQTTIDQLEKTKTVTNAVVPGLLTGLAKLVPLGVGENLGNVIQSTFNADPTGLIGPNADQQRLAQAQLSFSIAYLRKTSGAAFGATEVSNTIQEYFPVIGDSKQVIAQKAAARKRAIDGMKISTNAEGKKYIDSFKGGDTPAAGVDTSNPLLR